MVADDQTDYRGYEISLPDDPKNQGNYCGALASDRSYKLRATVFHNEIARFTAR
jgi:hypothetical protein